MNKKRVLILGNYWPYVRGGHRVAPLMRNLSKYGYDPILITMWPKGKSKLGKDHALKDSVLYVKELSVEAILIGILSKFKILSFLKKSTVTNNKIGQSSSHVTPGLKKSFFQKLKKFISSTLYIPDEYNLSFFRIKRRALEYLNNNNVDIILSEFPVIFHMVASNISKKHSIPWIADFVDPLADNFNYPYGALRHKLDILIQKKCLSKASGIVTVSPVWSKNSLIYNKKSHCIEHSYKEKIPPKESALKSINILYAGRIYPELQDYKMFFTLLNSYLRKTPELKDFIKVSFVGEGANDDMQVMTHEMNLSNCISIESRVDQERLAKLKEESDLLIMFSTKSSIDGWYTSKLFDYIGANRPILVFGHNKKNIIVEFILQNNIGYFINDDKSFSELFDRLISKRNNFSRLENYSKQSFVDRFHETKMAERFAKLFDESTK